LSDASATARTFSGRLSVRLAVPSGDLKRSPMLKPNLVAIWTLSQRPLKARPSSSSLVKGP
jgi:hypothetical protein